MDGCRGTIAPDRDADRIGYHGKGYADGKRGHQCALSPQGNQHIVGHAVDESQRDRPDHELQGNGRVGHIARTTDDRSQRIGQDSQRQGERQGDDHQHAHGKPVSPVHALARGIRIATHQRKEGDGEGDRHDVDRVDDLVGDTRVESEREIALDRLEQDHVGLEKGHGEQVVDHERPRLDEHRALQPAIEGQAWRPEGAHGQDQQDPYGDQVGRNRDPAQPHDAPAGK